MTSKQKIIQFLTLAHFEHVGRKNFRMYMETVHRGMKDDGSFLLHTIGHNRTDTGVDPWIEKYIFPNGMIPQSSAVAHGMVSSSGRSYFQRTASLVGIPVCDK